MRGGGQVKFTPMKIGGAKGFSHTEGERGGTSFGVVFLQKPKVFAILNNSVLPCLKGTH